MKLELVAVLLFVLELVDVGAVVVKVEMLFVLEDDFVLFVDLEIEEGLEVVGGCGGVVVVVVWGMGIVVEGVGDVFGV